MSLAQIYQKFILFANNSLNTIHIFLSIIKSSLFKVDNVVVILYKQNYKMTTCLPTFRKEGDEII